MAGHAVLTTVEPESDRYRAELLFVRGLWVDGGIWRAAAAGFAHRGWRCVVVDRPEPSGDPRDRDAPGWAEVVADAVRTRAAKPIVIGHDAGALVALDLASRGLVRGVVAVAPLLDGLRPVLTPLARLLLRLRPDASVVPPPAFSHGYFARIPAEQHAALRSGLRPERADFLRAIERLAMPPGPSAPALLVAQQADEVAPQLHVEICARGIEADLLRLQGSHWPMLEPRVDDWVTQIHRWIIKRVGHGLLVLRGDEDLVEP